METIQILIFFARFLNIFFLFYILVNNCLTITIHIVYTLIFYIDLIYRFLAFIATLIITYWKKCFKSFQILVLILTIINFIIYIIDIFSLVTNFKEFNSYYYDCPYLRKVNEMNDNNEISEYKRTCLSYKILNNNTFQYICFYNSTDEYINKYYDGLLCKNVNNINDIANNINCQNINFENIENQEDFNNIKEYMDKSEHKEELYLCTRITEIDKNNKLTGNKCPDKNPIKSYIYLIYEYIFSYFLECLFFIYLNFYLKNIVKDQLKKEKEKNDNIQQKKICNTSYKDKSNNTNENQKKNERKENKYNQREELFIIEVRRNKNVKEDSKSKNISDTKVNEENKNEELINQNLIKIKACINENLYLNNYENNKNLLHNNDNKSKTNRILLSEERKNDNIKKEDN